MARRKSDRAWLQAHERDAYVRGARASGYRSRAAFKLLEIDERARLLRPGMTVVDLGASPGGWSQVAAERVGSKGRVVALDILPMAPLEGVTFVRGDFHEQAVLETLLETLSPHAPELVMSDMAPNMSGIKAVDQPRIIELAELALDLCGHVLAPGGHLVVKVFQGQGYQAYLDALRCRFARVQVHKPQASRSQSAEQYLLAHQYGV
ncbi:MAG: 23S rRNA methyltransferase [Gammaproteobacteria bacterium]|nr:23S rRNA methyltransferase [Gammaproteobacteria bacterium]NIR82819.1 23S rRNA methyltransferase [Gammaproteobacteria bacterium]NIR89928.1 23S rRNA methyltransferase [Gammaproteobacteria bacterium]NIU03977.1 23S rRNA methyltransferase [Gammaproteobacteria bacterium]NIV51297.1 23S rRNA methyltransferase [Gammaproteobacteria bacterium]